MARTNSSIEISTLPEFLEIIGNLPAKEHLFRGQSQDWDLTPKIARLSLKRGSLPETEANMLLDLQRRALPWLTGSLFVPQNDWDWLALAQHHEMATRLLDWTENPLVALWFAVENRFVEQAKIVGDNCPVIWIFPVNEGDKIRPDDKGLEPLKITKTRVFRPNQISPRIIAQDGWFTAHAFHRSDEKKNGFVSLNRNINYKERLTKLRVNVQCVGALREDLRRCGLHPATIYPSLEGLCKDITQRHSKIGDETRTKPTLEDAPRKKLVWTIDSVRLKEMRQARHKNDESLKG